MKEIQFLSGPIGRLGATFLTAMALGLFATSCIVTEKDYKGIESIIRQIGANNYKGLDIIVNGSGEACIQGNVTPGQASGHTKIAAGFQFKAEEVCQLPGTTTPKTTRIGMRKDESTPNMKVATIYGDLNGIPIAFRKDEDTARKLSEQYGGDWEAFAQQETITMSPHPKLDNLNFGYISQVILPLSPSGEVLPDLMPQHVVISVNNKEWVTFTGDIKINYPDVLISIATRNPKGEILPWRLSLNSPVSIDALIIKNTKKSKVKAEIYGELIRDGETVRELPLRKITLKKLDRATVSEVQIPTEHLESGIYVLRITARDGKKRILGEKVIRVELEG